MAGILADVNSYSIKVAVFRGTNKTDLVKRNEYGYKCMLVAVKQNDTLVDVGKSTIYSLKSALLSQRGCCPLSI